MQKKKKRIKRTLSYFKKSNLGLINKIIRILSWLLPGLVIKRWMITSAIGLLTSLLGIAIWTNLRPLYWLIEVFFSIMNVVTKILPISVLGPLILMFGLLLIGIGQNRSINSIQKALVPEKNTFLVDALRVKSKLNRGPNIVAIGGGTGLSTLLKGLKNYSSNITAIVTVSDDGGSSGVLRKQLGVQPPGDIRNCLAALSNEEPILTRLFQYRFSGGSGLEGHSFGNLFLFLPSDALVSEITIIKVTVRGPSPLIKSVPSSSDLMRQTSPFSRPHDSSFSCLTTTRSPFRNLPLLPDITFSRSSCNTSLCIFCTTLSDRVFLPSKASSTLSATCGSIVFRNNC